MIDNLIRQHVEEIRKTLRSSAQFDQAAIDNALAELAPHRKVLHPRESDEPLVLVDDRGEALSTVAPRWLCHLLGLRHRAVHVLITWRSSSMGPVFLFQLRSWAKVEYPGHLDLSATGHEQLSDNPPGAGAAERELHEELGLDRDTLTNPGLTRLLSYESREETSESLFLNIEWREVFVGTVEDDWLGCLSFNDDEVASLSLCPELSARQLLNKPDIPVASALKESLPRILSVI